MCLQVELAIAHSARRSLTVSLSHSELQEYWLKRSPIIFHQTRSSNICASIIHKNDVDCNSATARSSQNFQKLLQLTKKSASAQNQAQRDHLRNIKTIQQLTLNNVEIPNENDIVVMPEISETDAIRFNMDKLKANIEKIMQHRQDIQASIATIKDDIQKEEGALVELKSERKIKERTNLLLENPTENLAKMEKVLSTTQERINKLHEQWEEHRSPLMKQLEQARQSTSKKYVSPSPVRMERSPGF